ncbi:MAG: twin-arginine translocase subunit TatC [Bacteroidales bacterium]|nr:twin-arginine translocase subunit TatC [Bacteroidales bacterium]
MASSRDVEMSFWDHLEALRGTLFRSVLALTLLTVLAMCFPKQLFAAVMWPTREDFLLYRLPGVGFSMSLINIEISAQFFVYLKMSALCAVIAAFPYIIYQVWRFISPALYDSERRAVKKAFGFSSGLFYMGVAVGYFIVLPVCLMFFVNFSLSGDIVNTISLNSYISLFVSLVFLIGLIFEFPTVILALGALGLIHRGTLRKGRKYAVVATLLVAALITPSDPFSMFVLALPLYGLFELSILLCKE